MSGGPRRDPSPAYLPLLVGMLVAAAVGGAMARTTMPWTLTMDTGKVFLGQTVPAFRAWMTGRIPEWSDLLWGGFPLLGDCTTAALYPLHVVAYVASRHDPLRFFDVAFALHLGLFAAGTAALLGTLGAGRGTVAFGGVLAALCPFAHFCGIAFFPVLGAQAWWPWGLVAAERLSRPGTPLIGGAMTLGWVALAAQVLVGVPEQATYAGVLMGAWVLTRRGPLPAGARLGRLALLAVGAVALPAPQLLPTMASLPLAGRALEGGEIASLWLRAPERLVIAGTGVMNGVPAFLGVAAPLLMVVAVLARRPRAAFLLVVAVVCFALATGPQAGLYEWLNAVPPFDRFRSPIKLYAIAEFAVVWAAALGVDALWRRGTAARVAAALLATAAFAERGVYLPAEVRTFASLQASQGLTPAITERLAHSEPVRTHRPGQPPPVMHDLAGMAGGGYASSLGALVGLSSLRAGMVALITSDHLLLLNRRHASTVLGAGHALVPEEDCALAERRYKWPVVDRTPDFCMLKNPTRTDRFSLVQRAVAVATVAEMVEEVGAHPNGPVPVVGDAALAARRGGGEVTIRAYESGRAALDVALTAPALLLVRESRLPGWDVRVDGAPAEPVPAAGLYFAVPLEPGQHTVQLRFRAPGFRTGGLVALAWIAGATLWAARVRRR
jgi:hypothetical protein